MVISPNNIDLILDLFEDSYDETLENSDEVIQTISEELNINPDIIHSVVDRHFIL